MGYETDEPLKLLALDTDDLKVVSAHLQDAVMKVGDMIYIPSERRFAAILNRFDWIAAEGGVSGPSNLRRCRCALRFDRVLRAQILNIDPGETTAIAELLAVTYDEADAPGGYITLFFAGGSAVRLYVECIEAELRDLGVTWRTGIKPAHRDTETPLSNTVTYSPRSS